MSQEGCGEPVADKIIIVLEICIFLVAAEQAVIYTIDAGNSKANFIFHRGILNSSVNIQAAKAAGSRVGITDTHRTGKTLYQCFFERIKDGNFFQVYRHGIGICGN